MEESKKGYVKHKNAAKVEECDDVIDDLKAEKEDHLETARLAKEYYRGSIQGAAETYVRDTAVFNAFLVDYSAASSRKRKKAIVERCAKKLANSKAVLEHDYVEDKGVPAYHQNAQPGPVYFMSHATYYLHVIVIHSLGDKKGPSKFNRNHVFSRHQCVGPRRLSVSKGSNDTIATVLATLNGEPPAPAPPVYRTGYDEHGPVREPSPPARSSKRRRR